MDFKIIAITKSEGSISKDFISKIEGQKSRLIVVKTSKIVKCDSKIGTSLFNKISMLSSGYIIFLSPNAVNIFLKIAFDLNQINEVVDNINSKFSVIAIGPSTRNILIQNKIIVDYMPEDNSSFGMIDLLSKLNNNNNNNNNNLKIIIPRSLLGDKYLKTKLEELGFDVYDFHIYSVEPAEIDDSWLEFLDLLKKGKIDSLIFTSPSNVRFLVNILRNYSSELLPLIYKIKLILSIGPLTSKELVKYNISSFVESKNHSLDGIYNTLYCNNKI